MTQRRLPRLTRRGFLRMAGFTAVGAAFGYARYVEPHWLDLVRRELPVAHLPPAWHGRKLVQISDLHIGPVVDDDYIMSAIERACALEPDVLAITGDFVTYEGPEQLDQASRVLERLRPARLATVGVLGNHDYGDGWSHPEVAEALEPRLRAAGIQVLRNQSRQIDGLTIAGLDDYWGPFFGPAKVLAELQPERPALVLCHNPDAADRPVWAGYRGWILSGHTHGGQCKPPYFRPPFLPVANKRYTAGEFPLADGRRLYINRGLGYLTRARFNVRPEITQFTLVPERSS